MKWDHPSHTIAGAVSVYGRAEVFGSVQQPQRYATPIQEDVRDIPPQVKNNAAVMFAKNHIPVAEYGHGADIISAGLCRVWETLQPTREECEGLSQKYQECLNLVGAREFARSLLEVRTIGQEQLLEGLVRRATAFIPRMVLAEHQRQELDVFLTDLFGEIDYS